MRASLALAFGVGLASCVVCRRARAEEVHDTVERLKASTRGLAIELPWRGGVVGGLGGTAVTHDGARTTLHQLGWSNTGTLGFHAGLAGNWSWLYTTASYDYALLSAGGNLQHAAVGAGLCLPDSARFLPFAVPTVRAWWLRVEGPSDTTWSSGIRASGTIDLGIRITPLVVYGKFSRVPQLLGLTLRTSIPVVGGGGAITTAAFTFYGDVL